MGHGLNGRSIEATILPVNALYFWLGITAGYATPLQMWQASFPDIAESIGRVASCGEVPAKPFDQAVCQWGDRPPMWNDREIAIAGLDRYFGQSYQRT